MRKLTHIYIYPIKSLGGIALDEAVTQERGLQHDRRWMLVDEQGVFMSQRKYPKMALLKTSIEDENLRVTAPNGSAIDIPLEKKSDSIVPVTVWGTECNGYIVDPDYNSWFSDQLDINCRLVYMGDQERTITSDQTRKVSYADGYPFLVLGQPSLDDLNSRLKETVPMDRFRPNLVFSEGSPFEEDQWGDFRVGDVTFYGVKPCARCVMTTIDQNTARKGKEPLKTLATYRQEENKIYIGLNAIVEKEGVIKVGDEILVISKKQTFSVNAKI